MTTCRREADLWEAIAAGRWPETGSAELHAHVSSCRICRELADVAEAIHADAIESARAAEPPTSAIVWWRAQMRARQEAAHAADRPMTIAHALAVAAGCGLTLALMSIVVPWLRPFLAGLMVSEGILNTLPALDLTQQWGLILPAALFVTLVLAPVALYLVFAGD